MAGPMGHVAVVFGVALIQAAAADVFTLADVAVLGARRLTAADVLKAGGLALGQTVTVPTIAAAAERLNATGLFRTVRYRYVTMAKQLTVTFEVEEVEGGTLVAFDNFVWFTHGELVTAVRATVPTFDGTAPDTGGVLEGIRQSLSALLKARGLPGQVRYTPDVDLKANGRLTRHLFSVTDPSPRLCAIRLDGAVVVSPRDILAAIPGVVGQDYSSVRLEGLADGTLTDVYRQRGFWRAAFGRPTPNLDANCGGVNVAMPISEGPAFAFAGVEWSGNTSLAGARLDWLFSLRRGAIANIRQVDEGLRQIKDAYGREGHILEEASYVPRLDDAARRVTFAVTIVEGPQFRLGSVEFVGFTDREAEDLNSRWRLRPGDVYNASYPDDFNFNQALPLVRSSGAAAQLPAIESRVDPERLVVHVRLVRR